MRIIFKPLLSPPPISGKVHRINQLTEENRHALVFLPEFLILRNVLTYVMT